MLNKSLTFGLSPRQSHQPNFYKCTNFGKNSRNIGSAIEQSAGIIFSPCKDCLPLLHSDFTHFWLSLLAKMLLREFKFGQEFIQFLSVPI